MKDTSFDTGLLSFTVNGDKNRVISFNPNDPNLVTRLNEVKINFDKLSKEYSSKEMPTDLGEMANLLTELEQKVRENVNYLFNADIHDTLFNGTSPFSMVNGKLLLERVFDALAVIIEEAVTQENKKSMERVNKYKKEYK